MLDGRHRRSRRKKAQSWRRGRGCCSEFEAGLSGGVSQGLDAAVIEEAAAVENDAFDVDGKGFFSDAFADDGASGDVGAQLLLAHVFFEGGGRRQGGHAVVVNDLGVDVAAGPAYAEARHGGGASQAAAEPGMASGAGLFFRLFAHSVNFHFAADAGSHWICQFRPEGGRKTTGGLARPEKSSGADFLALLESQFFAGVADAFAMIGVGRAEAADSGGDLADQLLVNAFEADVGLV